MWCHTITGANMAKEPSAATLRVSEEVRDLLRLAADKEHRSMANMVEVLILRYCETNGISVDAKRKAGKRS